MIAFTRSLTMKRVFLLAVLLVTSFSTLFTSAVKIASASGLSAACANYSSLGGAPFFPGDGNGSFGPFNAGEVITVTAALASPGSASFRMYDSSPFPAGTLAGPAGVPGTLTYTVPFTGGQGIGFQNLPTSTADVSFTVRCAGAGGSDVTFTDGRLNKFVSETNQTAAIYCNNGVITILTTKGKPVFTVTQKELNKFVDLQVNTLIKQKSGIRLYWLSSGQLELHSPALEASKGDYVFRFNGCPQPH